jgi:hypothetical protein
MVAQLFNRDKLNIKFVEVQSKLLSYKFLVWNVSRNNSWTTSRFPLCNNFRLKCSACYYLKIPFRTLLSVAQAVGNSARTIFPLISIVSGHDHENDRCAQCVIRQACAALSENWLPRKTTNKKFDRQSAVAREAVTACRTKLIQRQPQ